MRSRPNHCTAKLRHGLHVRRNNDVLVGVFVPLNTPDAVWRIGKHKIYWGCACPTIFKLLVLSKITEVNALEWADGFIAFRKILDAFIASSKWPVEPSGNLCRWPSPSLLLQSDASERVCFGVCCLIHVLPSSIVRIRRRTFVVSFPPLSFRSQYSTVWYRQLTCLNLQKLGKVLLTAGWALSDRVSPAQRRVELLALHQWSLARSQRTAGEKKRSVEARNHPALSFPARPILQPHHIIQNWWWGSEEGRTESR